MVIPPLAGVQVVGQQNRAAALFGQFDYQAKEQLTFTVGGRYSLEEKTFHNKPASLPASRSYSQDWDSFSPKLGVS